MKEVYFGFLIAKLSRYLHLLNARGQLDEQFDAIRLNLCLVCRTVAVNLAAFGATVNNDVSLACVGLGANGFHLPPTGIGSVTGIDIHVQRPKTKRAVVA